MSSSHTQNEPTHFRLCSSCKRPLPFGERYYTCSVSTCNRSKMTLTFCSVNCFQAHVPVIRHREAWAEEQKAPTREAFMAARAAEQEQERTSVARKNEPGTPPLAQTPGRRAAASASGTNSAAEEPTMSEAQNEVLVVVSKVKTYIRARSSMNTADAASEALSNLIRAACDKAIENAKSDGRKTVMARDFETGA
jgi:hypothetical protein